MTYIPIIIFILLTAGIFLISRLTLKEIFYTLRSFIRHDKTVFLLVCTFFFPGTVLHELAHFIVAIATGHRVRSISVFPAFEKNYIKLGTVIYEKKDFVRSIAIGIAPIFAGLALFWFFGVFQLFPSSHVVLSIIFGYLIFVISTTMFSSKQDLVDLIYIVPLLLVALAIMYVFNIRADIFLRDSVILTKLIAFMETVNIFLFFSLVIHGILIFGLKVVRMITKR